MTRFRCPRSSSEALGSDSRDQVSQRLASMTLRPDQPAPGAAGPSRLTSRRLDRKGKAKDKGKGREKTPGSMSIGQKEKLRMNAKQERVRMNINLMRVEWSFVFVGNLNQNITQEVLQKTFKQCGRITRIQIRASQGVPLVTGVARGANDRRYASVEFTDVSSARRALALNGRIVNGVKLLVCLSAADLPEITDVVRQHMTRRGGRPKSKFDLLGKFKALKRFTTDGTQVIHNPRGPSQPEAGPSRHKQHFAGVSLTPIDEEDTEPPSLARRKVMGVSFAQTVI